MENGGEALKGRTLKTLDPVVFDKEPEATSAKSSRRVKARLTSLSDRELEANDAPWPPITGSLIQCQKKAVRTGGHDADDDTDDDDVNGDLPHPYNTGSVVHRRKRVATKQRHDDDDCTDDDEDGDLPCPSATSSPVHRREKAATTQRHDDDDDTDDDVDGEERCITPTRPTGKRPKKAGNKRKHNDDDGSKVHRKRPWSAEECGPANGKVCGSEKGTDKE